MESKVAKQSYLLSKPLNTQLRPQSLPQLDWTWRLGNLRGSVMVHFLPDDPMCNLKELSKCHHEYQLRTSKLS